MYNLLKSLTAVPSPSGRERKAGEYILSVIEPYIDEAHFDAMGNLIAFKKGTAENPKKLMLAAHMDELGLMVTHIDEHGLLRVTNIGGVNYGAAAYTEVLFENGTKGVLVPNARTGAGEWRGENVYIDIGAVDRSDAEKKVKIGDVAIYAPGLTRLMHRRIAGHALDDKIGCVIMMKALTDGVECVNDTYFVFTVQEEVGCRGSKTAAFAVAPDWAVAFDVCSTGCTPNASPMECRVGDGAAIKVRDSSVLCDVRVVDLLRNLAVENRIKYQMEILEAGGTDTSSMQMSGAGALAGCISIPTRYIHSGVEMIDMADADACLALTEKLLATKLD